MHDSARIAEQDMDKENKVTVMDAATVVVARDCADGIEVLMLKKNSKIFFGGMWVFPGGRVDAEDAHPEDTDDITRFKRAAVREADEEAGIQIDAANIVHFSHWMPPPVRPKRFSTHFFLAHASNQLMDVEVDGGEITEHMWTTPRQALARRHAGEIEVVTPTFVTLDWLRRYARVADVIADINGPVKFHTHITAVEDGNIAFYHGDVAYNSLDPSAPGPRRRANMLKSGWWWEEHDGNGNGPWTQPVDFELPNESSDK
ncbi:MAG: NUDIX hydrolase [Gammaproteobacteria bacterium]|nr:NUDIX hydrolase [Gammaproteobacteria bacterium]